ncbi:MAG: hypothetical protein WAK50_09035 [Nitrososphaeraceae archaeon]
MNKNWSILVFLFITLSSTSVIVGSSFINVNASKSISTEDPSRIAQSQPQIASIDSQSASNIFYSKAYELPSNSNNLVVLIPNEGHHGPGEDDEARFLAQSFVPETAVVSKGTNVIWFNGDVGHEHDIVVMSEADSTSPIYQTGEFTEFEARNYTFNEVGQFQFADTVEYDNGYIMRGNISVTDDIGNTGLQQSLSDSDIAGLLMVPTQDISQYTTDLHSRGFVIDSVHNFQDLRGGQSGTGDEQTLIVWRAPTNTQITNVLSQLSELSSQLPYS